jgi:hypothetical protein
VCAVVIATGLVAISRGLSNQLHASRMIDERQRMLLLAESVLAEQQCQLFSGIPVAAGQPTVFPQPDEAYQWVMHAQALEGTGDEELPLCRLDATITREDGRGQQVRLWTVWPASRIPPEWF